MSEDEVFLLMLAVVGSVWSLVWIWRFWAGGDSFRPARGLKMLPTIACVTGLALLLFVLQQWADDEVQGHAGYLFICMGLGWSLQTLSAAVISPWFGLSAREDIVGRRNLAASFGISGVILGAVIGYAGSNIGEGPSLWNQVFCALLTTGGLFLGWGIVQGLGNITYSITHERDTAAGLRLAGFLVGAGVVLGRSVAGDWLSIEETVNDFLRSAWPVLVLALFAGALERLFRPTRTRPFPDWKISGVVPALLYLSAGILCAISLGKWEGS